MCTDICPDQTAIWKWAKKAASCLVSQCSLPHISPKEKISKRCSPGSGWVKGLGPWDHKDQWMGAFENSDLFVDSGVFRPRGIYRIYHYCLSSFCFSQLPDPAQGPPSTRPPPAPLWTFSCPADSHENVHLHWSHAPVTLEPWSDLESNMMNSHSSHVSGTFTSEPRDTASKEKGRDYHLLL